ncbi:MAG: asparagine synthase (glutamine-hydrolyzing), partial [Candidatus Hydrothermarchaeota archaeon]|nr:asparagine synthase (glutamine-hydrolyzing) [Candidatus Hydrothermarchaeota archaeon]
ARDRLGIKPLYYYFNNGRLIFASEIKAILKCPEIKRQLYSEALRGFIVFGYTPGKATIFEKIFKLLPGNTLVYDIKSKKVDIKEYWDVGFSHIEQNSERYFVKGVIDNLRESVEAHLVSDVPLGVFLSGGVDSSSIAALMSDLVDTPIKTFTIGFEDKSYDESAYAKMVAENLGTEHYERIISPEETLKLIEEITPSLDEPFGDVSMFPTYLVSKWARRKVKVVLDGDGGDEIFAGYHWYQAQRIWDYYSYMPNVMQDASISISKRMKVSESKKGMRTLIKRFMEGAALESPLKHVRWKLPNFDRNMLHGDWNSTFDEIHDLFQKAKGWHPLNQMLYVDIKTSLPNDMLAKVDRMSMLNSLEVRVPFLDHNFVEFTAKIPPSLKMRNLKIKYILKKAMGNMLPREALYRSKQGFSIPMKNWLKGGLKSTMLDLVSRNNIEKRGYFDWYLVNKLIEQHLRGERDNWHLLWRLMSLEIWHRNYLDS